MQKSRHCWHRRSCERFLTTLCFASPAFPAGVPLHLCHGEQRLPQLRSRAGWAAYRAGGLHGHRPQPPLRHLPCDPLCQEAPDGESPSGPVGSAGRLGPLPGPGPDLPPPLCAVDNDGHRRQARVEGLHRGARGPPAPGLLLWHLVHHGRSLRYCRARSLLALTQVMSH